MTRRRKPLSPEDRALWDRVTESAKPLVPAHPLPVAPPTAPKPQAQETPGSPAFRPRPFQIGQKAVASRPGHDLLPDVKARVEGAPLRMDRKRHMKMTKGKVAPDARIDLHGMTLAAAHPALIRFVLSAHAQGQRLVLVITGKGRAGQDDGPIPVRPGVLRHQVPHWLDIPPLADIVLQVRQAHARHGGDGAFYVYLRRGR